MLSLNASGYGEELKKEKAATMIKKIMKLFTKDPRDNFLIISDYRSLWLVHTVREKKKKNKLHINPQGNHLLHGNT